LLEEVPNNSSLAGLLLSRDKLPKADDDRIAAAVHRAFVKVVCAHAAEVGVTTKKSPTREKDFNDYCRRKWPPSGSAHIHRRIVKRKTSLDKQEDLAFAVAWSTEQMSGSFRWINYGKYGLQSYLKSFPNGKHAAQAKAWVDAK